jgi:uncharacterized protein YndB with AHSA1/START domain
MTAMTDVAITRTFDAPRETVYRAFVDRDLLARWFGPVGWRVPPDSVSVDPRPGGHLHVTVVNGSDAAETSVVRATLVEVVEDELLVAEEPSVMRLRLDFSDEKGGGTRVVLRQGPCRPEREAEAREGWSSSFTRLDRLLARRPPGAGSTGDSTSASG